VDVVGQGAIALFALLYFAGIALVIVAIVMTVVSLVRIARATERIANALEQRPPGQSG
jgi:TM2 domain-containing membrane protein YozV